MLLRPKQLSLIKDPRKDSKLWWIVKQGMYGGDMNYRKLRRPFDSKKLTHSVFKSRPGYPLKFTAFKKTVREVLALSCARYGIKLKDSAINHDHIHILFYTNSREAQVRFLRFFAAELGRRFAALRKKLGYGRISLWKKRPFTRLVSWGKRSLQIVQNYIRRNRDEAMGFTEYKPRNHALNAFLQKWQAQFSSA